MCGVGLDLRLLALRQFAGTERILSLGSQTVTQIVITALGLLPEIIHLAVRRGPDPAVASGQGQEPSNMLQFTGSELHLDLTGGLAREEVSLRFSCNDTELLPWCLGLFFKQFCVFSEEINSKH